MGFFSRLANAVSRAIDVVVDPIARVFAPETRREESAREREPAPAVPTVYDEAQRVGGLERDDVDSAADWLETALDGDADVDEDDAQAARERFTERLGPIGDESSDRSPEQIELSQWLAFFDAHADVLPPEFRAQLEGLAFDPEFSLDGEIYSTVEMDAPRGKTP